jgi:hypothetical protein
VDQCELLGVPSPIDLVEMIQCVMPDGTEEDWWDFYVGAYIGLKSRFIDAAQPTPCENEECPTVCPAIPESFSEIDDVDDAIDFMNDEMEANCMDICEGQATMVANMVINSCPNASPEEIHDLVLEHCNIICGWQNPLGMLLYEVDHREWM